MPKNYSDHFSTRATPQTEPIAGKSQVKNDAGGYVFAANDWTRLQRFLILGSEGGTYYASEKDLTIESANVVLRCAKEDAKRTVDTIVEISRAGRAPKNDPALFALVLCIGAVDYAGQIKSAEKRIKDIKAEVGNPDAIPSTERGKQLMTDLVAAHSDLRTIHNTRNTALAALPLVCRTSTHLFKFLGMIENYRGWGRSLKRAVAAWYNDKSLRDLAYQVIKYRQREGFTHADALRLSRPTPTSEARNRLYKYIVDGVWSSFPDENSDLAIIDGFRKIQELGKKDSVQAANLIRDYKLPREAVPTELLTEVDVWSALLEDMPITAMIRNLGTMSKIGLLKLGNFDAITKVTNALRDVNVLKKGRVHPISLLTAMLTYKHGHGLRGDGSWIVVPQIVDALNDAYYLAFDAVEPTNKSYLFGVDVSGSMDMGVVGGIPGLSPRLAAAAMSHVIAKTEQHYGYVAVDTKPYVVGVSASQRLDDVMRTFKSCRWGGGTDLAIPMLWARENNLAVDVFVILTDNQTWAGHIHPSQAIDMYRQKTGRNAKVAALAMTASSWSIADPEDPGMMDFVGFSGDVPVALAEFARM